MALPSQVITGFGTGLQLGLNTPTAARFAILLYVLSLKGIQPTINSAFRSLSYQQDLYRRWRAGEPGIYQPARYSWHTVGGGFDLGGRRSDLDYAGAIWKALGGRWGGDFSTPDPNHFDFPYGAQPQAAY